jgi:transposase-like protein
MMTNTNKRYAHEFKQEAVRLLLTGNKSATQLGRQLGQQPLQVPLRIQSKNSSVTKVT